ncbi:MAG: hypothetical protein HQK98_08720 [Nitrospirae bacterium]|nr:hypothetical protein [Nitrospirota bacterium]
MKALKTALTAVVFVIALSASAFADTYGAQFCWNMDDGKTNEVYLLKVGVMDFGRGHYSLAGTKTVLTRSGTKSAVQIAQGNMELIDSNYEMGLQVSDIPGTNTLVVEDIHFVLDWSLNGYYYRVNDTESKFNGLAILVQCPQ